MSFEYSERYKAFLEEFMTTHLGLLKVAPVPVPFAEPWAPEPAIIVFVPPFVVGGNANVTIATILFVLSVAYKTPFVSVAKDPEQIPVTTPNVPANPVPELALPAVEGLPTSVKT